MAFLALWWLIRWLIYGMWKEMEKWVRCKDIKFLMMLVLIQMKEERISLAIFINNIELLSKFPILIVYKNSFL